MKELIKPNVIEESFELVNPNCPEFSIWGGGGCPNLECVCRGEGSTHSSIDEEEILF